MIQHHSPSTFTCHSAALSWSSFRSTFCLSFRSTLLFVIPQRFLGRPSAALSCLSFRSFLVCHSAALSWSPSFRSAFLGLFFFFFLSFRSTLLVVIPPRFLFVIPQRSGGICFSTHHKHRVFHPPVPTAAISVFSLSLCVLCDSLCRVRPRRDRTGCPTFDRVDHGVSPFSTPSLWDVEPLGVECCCDAIPTSTRNQAPLASAVGHRPMHPVGGVGFAANARKPTRISILRLRKTRRKSTIFARPLPWCSDSPLPAAAESCPERSCI